MALIIVRLIISVYVVCWVLLGNVVCAQQLPLIRDSEIEHIIRKWADPLFVTANLNPGAVTVRIVKSKSLNAFVSGGQNLFLHSGLLIATDDPNQVLGVIAHEVGHIAGGHLARTDEAIRLAQNVTLTHTLLGLGMLAIGGVAGLPNAAEASGALIAGGSIAGLRHFLSHTRAQERSADQFGLTLLNRNEVSARGLLHFLRKFEDQDLLTEARQDPYLRTHPLTRDRLAFIKNHVGNSRWSDVPPHPSDLKLHARMRAKLVGFLEHPDRVLQLYPKKDQKLSARYARAIAYYRAFDLDLAIVEVDALIAEKPYDAYFRELKGQILFENGRLTEAWPHYEAANQLLPDDPLLMLELARLEIEIGTPELVSKSITALEQVVRIEGDNNVAWWLLSIGYGREGRMAESALASGEQALLEGRPKDALLHSERASRTVSEGSPSWLRAQDIRDLATRQEVAAQR